MKEPGILNALGQAVKNAAVEQKSLAIGALTAGVRARREREEREREERLRQAECARMAGRRVTSGEFGDSEVEIYENGYVRVAGPSEGGRSYWMDESTPYENLIAISFERPDGGSSGAVGAVAAPSVATAGTAVKVVSMIAKRNPAVMAISAAGVAAAGAGAVAKIMSAKAVLTITTDQRVHVLTNQVKHPKTGIPMPRKDHENVGAVLEQTGNSVLTALGRGPVMSNAPALPSGQAEVSQGMSSPGLSTEDVAKRLRELAELREEGILDDADFAIAKRQLLGKL
ncbi:SHOCT domain-containing protein [Actinomyces oris]|uniref:SHOCT domain-containing protein n=1 Tax=Actinomyces oris TaxID=544580 RepID=UPI0031BB5358